MIYSQEKIEKKQEEIRSELRGAFVKIDGLMEYIEMHADCLKRHLNYEGVDYEMQGDGFQRFYADNLKQLNYVGDPEQEAVFKRAILDVVKTRRSIVIDPSRSKIGTKHDSDELVLGFRPALNNTGYQHMFIPIIVRDNVFGVLHIWFSEIDTFLTQYRLSILESACAQVQYYLKEKQQLDVSRELIRLHNYTRLLREMSSCDDLELNANRIAKYAKDAGNCSRVSLLIAKDYSLKQPTDFKKFFSSYKFDLFVIEGEMVPHLKSEEGEVLRDLSIKLLSGTLNSCYKRREDDGQEFGVLPPGHRESFPYIWAKRKSDNNTRGRSVLARYFSLMPMNWATVMPLVDRRHRICGILLFEGKREIDRSAQSLIRMRDLSYSAGYTLGAMLYWKGSSVLKWAQKWLEWRNRVINTPMKYKLSLIGVPVVCFLFVMVFPVQLKVRADAIIRPSEVVQVAAEVSARIVGIHVEEGDFVHKGDLLMELDSEDLELELSKMKSEYMQYLTESDRAMKNKDDVGLQMANLNVKKLAAQMEYMYDLLDKTQIRPPFDGLILGPQNLKQMQGKVSELGEILLEVARPGGWEVKVLFREQDIVLLENYLREGQHVEGVMKLKSDPRRKYPVVVSDVTQLMHGLDVDIDEKSYHFIGLFPLDVREDDQAFLKAGFSGRIAFRMGYKPLGYVLFRDAFRYIKVYWL